MAFRFSGFGWRVAHSLRTFGDQIMDLRGHTNSYAVDGTLGDADHSSRVSDHNPDEDGVVRALDFYEWQAGVCDDIFERLRLAEDPRLKYAIHDRRMFSSYPTVQYPAWTWRPYGGPNAHETHGHLSVVADSRADQTHPWDIQEDTMPLSNDDLEAIWLHLIDDPVTGQNLHAQTFLKATRSDAHKAAIDAAVARRIAEESAARGDALSPAEIEALGREVAEAFIEELTD